MAEPHGFSTKDSERIAKTVRRDEHRVAGENSYRRNHKGSGGGSTILYGKITAVTDVNNYTISVYIKSDLSDTPETSKSCYVMSIVDELAINDPIPIKVSNISGIDYECTQQMGAVG